MAQTRRVQDRSHPPHPQRFQTTLTTAQEAVADALRKTQRVSLDDLLAVVREFLNLAMSRSGLDRCLCRHGVGHLRDRKAKDDTPKHIGLKAFEPGHIHIDVKYPPHMANETSRGYLFVTIDRGQPAGLHCHVSPQDSRQCPALSRRSGTDTSNPYPHHFNRLWQGVHRPPFRFALARLNTTARV